MADVETLTAESTDEEIAAVFPGDDPAHIRSMLTPGKPNASNADGDPAPADDPPKDDPPADPAPAVRPDWMPEQFWTGDLEESNKKMAEGYSNLRTLMDRKKEDASDPAPPQDRGPNVAAVTDDDLGKLVAESNTNGRLSDDTYAEYEKRGVSRKAVDTMVTGAKAEVAQVVSAAHEAAGGADTYKAMMEWAGANLSEAEIQSYDRVMASGDQMAIKLQAEGLASKYKAARPDAPKLLEGEGDGQGGVTGYTSQAEMTADMRKPEYKTDPAFRAKVERRIAASKIFDNRVGN